MTYSYNRLWKLLIDKRMTKTEMRKAAIDMARKKVSETVTENLFRDFYGANTFIEKSAIPSGYGFTSKKGTSYSGYPDFFCDSGDYCIVVEAKATDHAAAQDEVQYYMINNKILKDIIGISVSGQSRENILVTYYLKLMGMTDIKSFPQENTLLSIPAIKKQYVKTKYGESVTTEALITVLKDLNKRFNDNNRENNCKVFCYRAKQK